MESASAPGAVVPDEVNEGDVAEGAIEGAEAADGAEGGAPTRSSVSCSIRFIASTSRCSVAISASRGSAAATARFCTFLARVANRSVLRARQFNNTRWMNEG